MWSEEEEKKKKGTRGKAEGDKQDGQRGRGLESKGS